MVLDITSLTPGDTIAVRNNEELEVLLGFLQDLGYLWRGGQQPLDIDFHREYISAISIQPNKRMTFWTSERYLERMDKSFIHSFDDLIFSPPELDADTPEPVIDLSDFLN